MVGVQGVCWGEGFTAGSSPSKPAFSLLSRAECCADGSLYLFCSFPSHSTSAFSFLLSLFVLSSVSRNESSLETCFGMHVRGTQAGFSGGQGPTGRESRKKRVGVVVKVYFFLGGGKAGWMGRGGGKRE